MASKKIRLCVPSVFSTCLFPCALCPYSLWLSILLDVFVAVCKKGCYNRCNMVNLSIATTFWCGNLQIFAGLICFSGRFSYFCDMKNVGLIPHPTQDFNIYLSLPVQCRCRARRVETYTSKHWQAGDTGKVSFSTSAQEQDYKMIKMIILTVIDSLPDNIHPGIARTDL